MLQEIPAGCMALTAVRGLPAGECMRALDVHVSTKGDDADELRHVLRTSWVAYHSRARFWTARAASPPQKPDAPSFRVPVLCLGGG